VGRDSQDRGKCPHELLTTSSRVTYSNLERIRTTLHLLHHIEEDSLIRESH
jgi:hypothetical protein